MPRQSQPAHSCESVDFEKLVSEVSNLTVANGKIYDTITTLAESSASTEVKLTSLVQSSASTEAKLTSLEESSVSVEAKVTSLIGLVEGLREYISLEHNFRVDAERRCAELEARLDSLSRDAPRSGAAPVVPEEGSSAPTPAPAPSPRRHLLIGDSMLRDINAMALENATVFALAGAKVSDISQKLSEITQSFTDITICVGGNNLSSNPDVQDFVEQYSTLISENKKLCQNLHITSVVPRVDTQLQASILEANALLKATCASLECSFVDLDSIFVLNNGQINDGYFVSDNVHLTLKGSMKLVSSLPVKVIKDKDIVVHKIAYNNAPVTNKPTTGSSTPDNEPRLFNGPGDILSNLAPCNLRAQNMSFCSVEQLYNYRKARICKAEHLIPDIMSNTNCWTIMKIAKQIPVVERFENIKFDIMADCLQIKLEQSSKYRDELIATGERRIIENTHNQVWGRGDPTTYDGLNMLGQLHEIKRRALISGKHSRTWTYKYCKTTKRAHRTSQHTESSRPPMPGRTHPVPAWGHGPANEEEPPPVLEPQPPQVPEWCHVTERSRRYPPAGMPPPGPANKRGPPARGPTTALAHRQDRRPASAGERL